MDRAAEAWADRQRLVKIGLSVVLVVLVAVTGLVGWRNQVSQEEEDRAAFEREKNPPVGVTFYDLTGTRSPEYATIGDEVVPLEPPADDQWWVPFVPFFGSVFAAVITAAVAIFTSRRGLDFDGRLSAVEKAQKGNPP